MLLLGPLTGLVIAPEPPPGPPATGRVMWRGFFFRSSVPPEE